jgi:Family of unknown function (DUF6113)
MGTPQGPPRRGHRVFTTVCYLVLFALGVAEGVVGSFQYSRSPAPLVAILLAALIFVTCLLCGLGMGSFAGGIVPAIGWFVASFVLSLPDSNGSVIITATTAGKWYLYGGALGAAAGAGAAFVLWVSRQPRRR